MALPPSQWQVQIVVGAGSRGGEAVAATASRSRGRSGAECGGGGLVRCGGAVKSQPSIQIQIDAPQAAASRPARV